MTEKAAAAPEGAHRSTTSAGARAPLGRVLRAELRWVLRRPRTLLALLLLAAVPVLLGASIAATGGPPPGHGPPALAAVTGNGLVLPVAALVVTQSLLLPLVVAMAAADALAGESANGTLRGLLLAPVTRMRLVLVKTFGVLVVTALAVVVLVASGVLTGLLVVGGERLITLSGTTLPAGQALGRVALAAGWSFVQMAAVGAVALAVSSGTDHPLVVVAATMGMLIVFGVLASVPNLEWLRPVLITTGWSDVMDVVRDPVPSENLATGLLRAGCYLLIGLAATAGRMSAREG